MWPQPGLPLGIQRTLLFRRQALCRLLLLQLGQDLAELLFEPGVQHGVGHRDDACGAPLAGGRAKERQQFGRASTLVLVGLQDGMSFGLPGGPWLGDGRSRAGISVLRGAMSPEMGRAEDVAKKIRVELEMRGLHKEPVGIDIIELPVLFALQKEGIKVVDGQQLMSDARVIKTQDEISLLNTSAMMVDAAYDELYRAMKPGLRENEAVGLVSKVLYDLGSEYVEAVNAISGERCNPHPHVFSDRVLRPGDPVYYDILHSYMGYRTCYYRCFTVGYASHAMVDAYKRCRDYLDAAIELVRPGRTTAEIAAVWPKAEEFGFPSEEACFALQYGHGIGLAIWEKPVISRLVSFDHPVEIKPGMVFALETFWPSTDGWSAARIEEEIVVTPTGHEVITRFPAEQLLVAGAHYHTVNGPLPTTRESEAAPSARVLEMIEASAKTERVGVSG